MSSKGKRIAGVLIVLLATTGLIIVTALDTAFPETFRKGRGFPFREEADRLQDAYRKTNSLLRLKMPVGLENKKGVPEHPGKKEKKTRSK